MPRSSRVRRRRYIRKRLLAQRRQARVRDVIAKLQAHTNPLLVFPEWLQQEYEHQVRELNADLFRDKADDHTIDVIRYVQTSYELNARLFRECAAAAISDDDE